MSQLTWNWFRAWTFMASEGMTDMVIAEAHEGSRDTRLPQFRSWMSE